MLTTTRKTWWLAALATAGMVFPTGTLMGDTKAGAATAATSGAAAAESAVRDVALTKDGRFSGRVLGEQGQALDGVVVKLQRRDAQDVLETTTDASGRFQFTKLKGGMYQVQTPQSEQWYRMWSADTAPAQAMKTVVLTSSGTVMRAQLGFLDPANTTSILLGAAGVTLSAITLAEVKEVKHDVDKIPTSP